jgi:hypothetical protein
MRIVLRIARFTFVLVLLAPLTMADAALRYHSEVQTASILPAAEINRVLGGNPDMLVRIKGDKAYSSQGHITSILDLKSQELTMVDAINKRFATVSATEYSQHMKTAIPAVPEEARAMLASLKTRLETRSTGRSEVIQGIQSQERELILTLDVASPGATDPSVPFMKMVMQVWMADPEEAQRVPALQEFKNYTASAGYAMNPAVMLEQIAASIPGLGEDLGRMIAEVSKDGGVALRVHLEILAPFLAIMSQQMPAAVGRALPAGVDPKAPLVQMNQELVEISSDPLDDSIFQIPADYQPAPLSEIMRGAVSAPPQFKP